MILIIFQKKKCFMKSQSWTTLTLSHLPPCNRSAWAEIQGYEGTACAAKPWGHSSWLNRARKKCEVKLAVCPVRFCVCVFVFFLPSKIYAAAAKSLQSCPTLCDPIDGSPPPPPSLGFSRQEHCSGLPFPSPMLNVNYTEMLCLQKTYEWAYHFQIFISKQW